MYSRSSNGNGNSSSNSNGNKLITNNNNNNNIVARVVVRVPSSPSSASSSSAVQMLSTCTSISVTFSPTNGRLQENTSMKLGSQYGCGDALNCRIFITLFSYFRIAAAHRTHTHTRTITVGTGTGTGTHSALQEVEGEVDSSSSWQASTAARCTSN